jgi:hypothetical protein
VSNIRRQLLRNFKRRIEHRLRPIDWEEQPNPMFAGSNIHYEVAERVRGIHAGGIGVMHMIAGETGLIDELNERVHVLKVHLPYHESDHVLNIAYNFLAGGTRLEHLELLRNNEVYLNALGAQRIPDPTTAGDFCRRFEPEDVERLMDAITEARLRVWKLQPPEFFEEAIIEADGTYAETNGECKQGMDISHKGIWGYHPLVVSLANTGEILYVVNRSGNRPSHEGAPERFDQAAADCRRAGFKNITFRGDTDFSQTNHLDRWDDQRIRFVFGFDAAPNLVRKAEELPGTAWKRLSRRPKHTVATEPRSRPENVKERIVCEREFENIKLKSEDVAEFSYSPTNCKKTYRIVVLRKNLSVEKGELVLFPDIRYFFIITNDRRASAANIVFEANARCNQENLIAQLKNGVRALHAPVDNLVSNWAYMVMASLAWTLKAWFALLLPVTGPWKKIRKAEKKTVLRMEFRTFLNAFMHVPAQIIRQGRKIIFRLLTWNKWQPSFFRLVDRLRARLRY